MPEKGPTPNQPEEAANPDLADLNALRDRIKAGEGTPEKLAAPPEQPGDDETFDLERLRSQLRESGGTPGESKPAAENRD